jgi:hypothetical protein
VSGIFHALRKNVSSLRLILLIAIELVSVKAATRLALTFPSFGDFFIQIQNCLDGQHFGKNKWFIKNAFSSLSKKSDYGLNFQSCLKSQLIQAQLKLALNHKTKDL